MPPKLPPASFPQIFNFEKTWINDYGKEVESLSDQLLYALVFKETFSQCNYSFVQPVTLVVPNSQAPELLEIGFNVNICRIRAQNL